MFNELHPAIVMTRDKKTYDMYKDYVDCERGIDCAFWVIDDFNPQGMNHRDYTISTFNRSREPEEIAEIPGVVHPWHMQFSLNWNYTDFLRKENLFISDNPYDYLTLYANATRCYTDLVHAVIPCLAYGTPVKYWKVDNRRDTFESLDFLTVDSSGFMHIDSEILNKEKRRIEEYLYTRIKLLENKKHC